MITPDKETRRQLIDIQKQKDLCLEGNVLKLFKVNNDKEFDEYLEYCGTKNKESIKKRMVVNKQVQEQNIRLSNLNEENKKMMDDLQNKITEIEDSKLTFEVQNRELEEWKKENIQLTERLQTEMINAEKARIDAEAAKQNAENDLDILQKKTQNELISTIVRVAVWVIMGVGFITTGVYVLTLFVGKDTQVISAAWSNIFGILLTNAFSIVGTIMGIKYATENKQ